jgi:phytoene dehydrogenase-like protein
MAREVDVVVIGSGHNGLVAAAYLARAGAQVEVLERNPVPGGAVATEELTLPGFRHDTFSSWHPLFHLSAAFAELGDELRARGLEYANTDLPAATAYGDGAAVCAYRDPERTASEFAGRDDRVYAAELERFGAHAETIAELLGTELWSRRAARLALRLTRRLGRRGALELARDVTASARSWLESRFEGDAPARLYGPWVLHTGLSPDAAGGAFQLLALAGGLHQVGMPVVRGGSLRLVEALVRLIEDHGGAVRTGTTVERILVERGRAVGVIAAGEEARARRAVIANVAPTQLYGQLLPAGTAPPRAVEQAQRFRYCARGDMQIHLALDEPPRWRDERLAGAAVVHVTEGLDAIAVACAEASAGLLPARPTIVCGQPTALDPSRAPEGRAILWIQLQETPYRPRADAAGEIDVGGGEWTSSLEDAYSERIVALLARHLENLPEAIIGRAIVSPAELERRNPNLQRGDPYAGATDLDQSYLWRPLPGYGSHRTPVPRLYQCGASTYPGPGLNAASGRIVAQALLGRRFGRAGRQ